MTNDNGRPDILRFVILVVILIVTLLVIAFVRPIIFDRIVPAIIGTGGEAPAPVEEENDIGTGGEENPENEDTTDEMEEEEATESDNASDELPTNSEEDDSTIPILDETEDETVYPTARPAIRHVVVAGDTLATIASQYNVPIDLIQQANQIEDANRITAGEVLLIPQP